MVICPECGKEVKEAKFCANCGALLPKVTEETIDAAYAADADDVKEDVAVDEVNEEAVADDVKEDVAVDEVNEEAVADDVKEEEDDVIDVKVKDASEKAPEASSVKKTKFCPNCGAEVDASVPFCPQCGTKLIKDEPQTKFCQSCGEKINIDAEICPKCGVRVANVVQSEEKNVLLATILSFLFPGLGQLYIGLSKKGVSFIIAYIVSCVLIFLLIGIVLVIIVWIWSLVDVIKSAEALNRGEYVEDKLF